MTRIQYVLAASVGLSAGILPWTLEAQPIRWPGPMTGIADQNGNQYTPLYPFPVVTQPIVATTTMTSGQINASGNVFQTILAANPNRHDCRVQNNGSHNMSVYPGASGSASVSGAFLIQPSGVFNCGSQAGVVMGETINITGTSGDAFAVASQ